MMSTRAFEQGPFTEVRVPLPAPLAESLLDRLDAVVVAPQGGAPWAWVEQPTPTDPSPGWILTPAVCFWVPERYDTPTWRASVQEALIRFATGSAQQGDIPTAEPLDEAPTAWPDSDGGEADARTEYPAISFTTGLRPPDPDAWREAHKPFRVGRIAIVPFSDDGLPSLRADDLVLRLPPGGAFGTGRHPTTRACLRALHRRVAPGQHLLDAGCGTGILAVAALQLGAESVLGLDLDETSIRAATQLAGTHDVGDRCSFRYEALGENPVPEAPFDGVLANIEDDVIRAQAGTLAALLKPGGWFIVSGCRAARRDDLIATLEAAGLHVEHVDGTFRWVTCAGRRADH